MSSRVMGGHGSELPLQLRDDLAHSLGSARRSRDPVLGSPSAIMPPFPEGLSSVCGAAVMAGTMAMSPPTMPKL